jgi:Holliday junction DNA helicase RuvA
MISSLSGLVKSIRLGNVVVEVGGVGLLVNLAPRTAAGLTVGTHITLHTVLVVREDSLTLYGFDNNSAREMFELLQTVTGIGPKVAQSALNVFETPELVSAIAHEQAEILERIPGLGKKGAQRVVLELREKVSTFETEGIFAVNTWRDQITSALLGLGFSARDSQDRIEQLSGLFSDVSSVPIADLLKAALSGAQK